MLKNTAAILDYSMVNPLMDSMGEDVMGFLNEIQLQYPDAISFASGRPDADYFDLSNFSDYLNFYVDTIAKTEGKTQQEILSSLGQYNRTKGIINKELAIYLEKDEQIKVNATDILVTVGTQEGLLIGITTLCDKEKDVIIVEDPAYVGVTHYSLISGYQLAPVDVNDDGISLTSIEEKIQFYSTQGKKVKIVYVIPDHQNPTGNSMSLRNRHRLLEMAEKYDFIIFEDNAYGDFSYDGNALPSIKSLDNNKRVIYLRSFSKTLYPSLRLSAMVVDQRVMKEGQEIALSDLMSKTKGYTTVNTPTILQAMFGGMLYKHNFSLQSTNENKVIAMKKKRDQIVAALENFLDNEKFPWAKGISWNIPQGGFFIAIKLPFTVNKKDVINCAENFKIIFTPMSFFYLRDGGHREIRLAFSNVSEQEIRVGIERLANFFKTKIKNKNN